MTSGRAAQLELIDSAEVDEWGDWGDAEGFPVLAWTAAWAAAALAGEHFLVEFSDFSEAPGFVDLQGQLHLALVAARGRGNPAHGLLGLCQARFLFGDKG